MKTLLLLRHGKSDWTLGVPDKERPLASRGINDAPVMGKMLAQKKLVPDLLYSSPAKRAWQTAEILAKAWRMDSECLVKSPELYLCEPFAIEEIIRFSPRTVHKIAIVGHNPSLSEVAGSFEQSRSVDLPTLGVYACVFDAPTWEEVSIENLVACEFLFPKLFEGSF